RESSMGQAGTPPNPIKAWAGPIAMTGPIIVAAAGSTDPGAVLLVQEPTALIAIWAAEPRALPLLASERPFHLDREDLGMTVERNGALGPTRTTDAQPWVGFQQPVIKPFQRPSASEGSDDLGEINLREGRLYACLQNFATLYVPPPSKKRKKERECTSTTNTTNNYYYTYYLFI